MTSRSFKFTRLALIILLATQSQQATALEALSPLAAVAKHCGSPDPSETAPEPHAVMVELTARLESAGWTTIDENVGNATELLEAIARLGLAPLVRFEKDADGTLTAFATNTTSGRGPEKPAPDPQYFLFKHNSGPELLIATAFRYKSNPGIDLRCSAFGTEAKETAYLGSFEPKSIFSVAREKAHAPAPVFADIGNINHPGSSEGHEWGKVLLSPLNAEHLANKIGSDFPFTLRLTARSYVIAQR